MAVAGAGASVVQRRDRIAVLRRGHELWRSSGRFRAAGVFATLGPRALAFSYDRYGPGRARESLYLAPLGGRERKLGDNERPLGWTRSGQLLTWRYDGGFLGLDLRASDGSLLRRVGARLREARFDPAGRSVLAATRSGLLERFDGQRWRRLADLGRLGFGRQSAFEPLAGGLIGVLDRSRVAVLHRDGSVFASGRFPAGRGRLSVAGQSGLVASATGSAVAFALTSGTTGYGKGGRESLYVLRPGDRRAREVYAGRLRFAACERWASLSWQGDWLLYATTEGKTLALDSRAPTRRVDLSGLVRRLASFDAQRRVHAQVEWAR